MNGQSLARTALDGSTRCAPCVRRSLFVGGVTLFMLWAPPWGHTETIPPRGLVDSRVRVVAYNHEEVYSLHGFVGYQIDLQFETGEAFVGLGAGDLDALAFVAAANHLFLKPKAVQVGTNLTVLTTKRSYQFEYTASLRRAEANAGDVIYSLRFTYAPPSLEEHPAARVERLLDVPKPTTNTDYGYCGSPAVRPVAASDDGLHTRLRFGGRAEQPAIFVRNDDGTESLLNFSMESGDVIVHRVAHQFVLRRGRLVGLLVNKAYAGAGQRLDSGTVSPAVERVDRTDGQRP